MRNAGNPELAGALLITAILVVVLVGLLALVTRLLNRRRPPPSAPKPSNAAKPAPAWLWFVVLVAMAAVFWVNQPINRGRGAAPASNPAAGWICLSVAAVPMLLVAWVFARVWIVGRDRDVKQAQIRADAGDLDGAILDLERAIAAKGPSANRLNGLGFLHARKDDWPAALACLREASSLAPKRFDIRGNLGVALLKVDDPAGAEAVLARALDENPTKDPVTITNYACSLIALGRLGEAEAQVDRAQGAHDNMRYLSTQDIRGVVQAEIDAARVKLEEARGNKAKEALDEL